MDIGGYEVVPLEKEFDHCYWFYFQQIDQVIQIKNLADVHGVT